jgi:aminoglycoside 6-adenylyltransferase
VTGGRSERCGRNSQTWRSNLNYDQLTGRLIAWARTRKDLFAILIVGSRARRDHPADEFSDLDLVLFTTHPAFYTEQVGWLTALGEVWAAYLHDTGKGYPEWQAVFAGGLKVDLLLCAVSEPQTLTPQGGLSAILAAFPYQQVLRRGFRVLFTRDAQAVPAPLWEGEAIPGELPSEAAFTAAVNGMLLEMTRAVRLLQHHDVWRAKQACDCAAKARLLQMLEWHAGAMSGGTIDAWYEGRFIGEWADPGFVAALPATFAQLNARDIGRALAATLDLYRQVALATATQLTYRYPVEADAAISAMIHIALS